MLSGSFSWMLAASRSSSGRVHLSWVAALAGARGYSPSHCPSLVVGVGRCVYPVFAVLVALVDVGDVAVASLVRGGWLASTGDGDGGVLTLCLSCSAVHPNVSVRREKDLGGGIRTVPFSLAVCWGFRPRSRGRVCEPSRVLVQRS